MKTIKFFLLLQLFSFVSVAQNNKYHTNSINDYMNVVLTADYADPTIIRVGEDFYMTHSSYSHLPGLLIWYSKDLKNWSRLCYALNKYVGEVWAPDFVYYKNKYYIYFPSSLGKNWVITADSPAGPWSEPIELNVKGIDPGHISTSEGKRYLYLNDGHMVELDSSGLSVAGEKKKIYEGWKYPADWVVEGFWLESPKLIYKNGYYYLSSAEGGTAGPSTSHMVANARAKNISGPWENSPYNPVVHTWSRSEKYWSKGHGTIFSDSKDNWYIVYHAYENGYYPLGRNTIIEPVKYTKDGWFKLKRESKVEGRINKLRNAAVESDDFSLKKLKLQWQFSGLNSLSDYELKNGALKLTSAENIRVLHCPIADHGFESSVKVETENNLERGLIVYYNNKMYAGIGMRNDTVFNLGRGAIFYGEKIKCPGIKYFKIKFDDFDLSLSYSKNGKDWIHYPSSLEVSGYHHNNYSGFAFLKIGVYCKGKGDLLIDDFRYSLIK